MFRKLAQLHREFRLRQQLKNDRVDWNQIKNVLENSEIVYTGLAGSLPSVPIQINALDYLAENHSDPEEVLFKELQSTKSNVVLVGYCLVGLQRLRSSKIFHLPESILTSEDTVKFVYGTRMIESKVRTFVEGIIQGAENA